MTTSCGGRQCLPTQPLHLPTQSKRSGTHSAELLLAYERLRYALGGVMVVLSLAMTAEDDNKKART